MVLSLRHTLITVVAALLLLACGTDSQIRVEAIDGSVWRKEVCVQIENSDTLALRQLNIVLRHNSNFDGGEIPLRIKVLAPDGRYNEEQHTLMVKADAAPSLISRVSVVPYRSDVQLSIRGVYMFVFEPLAELKGVEAVGVELKNE